MCGCETVLRHFLRHIGREVYVYMGFLIMAQTPEKLGKWRYIARNRRTFRYENRHPISIPNFICTHSPSIFLDFQGVSAFGVLAVTPFLHHFRIWLYWILSDYTILLKLLDGIIQRFGSHMNIPSHCCFDADVTQQFLQHFWLHTAFDCTRCIGVAQRVHTKVFDPCFVAELI